MDWVDCNGLYVEEPNGPNFANCVAITAEVRLAEHGNRAATEARIAERNRIACREKRNR